MSRIKKKIVYMGSLCMKVKRPQMKAASAIYKHCVIEHVIQFHWGPGYSYELQDYYFVFKYVVINDFACFKIHTLYVLDCKIHEPTFSIQIKSFVSSLPKQNIL